MASDYSVTLGCKNQYRAVKDMYKQSSYLVLMLFLVSCGVSKTSFELLEAENNNLQAELIDLKREIKGQNDRIISLETAKVDLQKDKESLTTNINTLEENFSVTQEKVKEFEFNLRDKQYQINLLWNELDDAFKDVESAVAESNQRIKSIEEFLYLDLNDQVNFDPGSDNINPEDEAQLEKLADMLKKNPGITMMVEGHTDTNSIDKSSDNYKDNWDLSVARSTQVIRKLESYGVNPKQLIAAGRGEHMPDPLADPHNLDAQRRTDFIIVPNVGKLYKMKKDGETKVIKP